MNFDPMTGEPINKPNEGEMNFDPMTGEPIQKAVEPAASEMNFDPMTGEPIQKAVEPAAGEMNFDPMTGEPIQKAVEPAASEMNFDPMTGEPIQKAVEPAASEMNFDPMTGQPLTNSNGNIPKRKSGKWKVAAGIAAGVIVIGGVAYAGVSSGAFLSKGDKVLQAATNTFSEENHLAKDLANASYVLASGKYTVSVKGEANGAEIDLEYREASSKRQVKGMLDSGYAEVEFDAVLDNKKVSVKIPSVDDRVFVYKYTDENDGYLVEQLGEDTVESLNELLKMASSEKEQEKFAADLANAIRDEYKTLKFTKVEKEKYEVDGKDRSCKGYETTITSDNMLNVIDEVEDIYEDRYGDALEKADVDIDEAFSEMRDTFRSMPDMDVTFYIYKNKLACINMDVDGEDAELLFLGGDTRTQNMKFEADGEEIFEVKGSTEDGVERTKIYINDKEYCDMKYDYKEGDFTIESSDLYVKANIDAKRNGVVVTLKDLEVDGMASGIEGEISIQKGAKVEVPDGEEFDLGNASESEIEDLSEDISASNSTF